MDIMCSQLIFQSDTEVLHGFPYYNHQLQQNTSEDDFVSLKQSVSTSS